MKDAHSVYQDGRKATRQDSLLCGADSFSRGSPPRSWLRKGFIVNRDTGTDLRKAEEPLEIIAVWLWNVLILLLDSSPP